MQKSPLMTSTLSGQIKGGKYNFTALSTLPYACTKLSAMDKTIYEYKVALYRENLLGSLFLAGSKVDPVRFSEFLNRNGEQGWEVVTMERESRRMLLFFSREAFMVIMKREKTNSTPKDTKANHA
jgi:hypothetical protein